LTKNLTLGLLKERREDIFAFCMSFTMRRENTKKEELSKKR